MDIFCHSCVRNLLCAVLHILAALTLLWIHLCILTLLNCLGSLAVTCRQNQKWDLFFQIIAFEAATYSNSQSIGTKWPPIIFLMFIHRLLYYINFYFFFFLEVKALKTNVHLHCSCWLHKNSCPGQMLLKLRF